MDRLKVKRIASLMAVFIVLLLTEARVRAEGDPEFLSGPFWTASQYDGRAVWFAGFWNGVILLKMDLSKREWETFHFTEAELCCRRTVVFEKDQIVFSEAGKMAVVFKKGDRSWSIVEKYDTEYYAGYDAYKEIKGIENPDQNVSRAELEQKMILYRGDQYLGLGRFLYKIRNHRVVQAFPLPPLLTETLLKYRPDVRLGYGYDESSYSFSEVVEGIKQNFGPVVLKEDRLWFGITFYEGEGFQGVGGLGFFDLKKERFGILRGPFLVNCSIVQIDVEGNDFWFQTESRGEFGQGLGDCSGWVGYNIVTRRYRLYRPPREAQEDAPVQSFIRVGSTFWAALSGRIAEFDGKTNRWKLWTIEQSGAKASGQFEGDIREGVWPEKATEIIPFMEETFKSDEAIRAKGYKNAEILQDKICIAGALPEIEETRCSINIDGFASFEGQVVNPIKIAVGGRVGFKEMVLGFSASRPGLPGSGFFSFRSAASSSLGGAVDLLEKGKKYRMANHQYRLSVEIVDFKMSPIADPHSSLNGIEVFEWIKLRLTAIRFPPVK